MILFEDRAGESGRIRQELFYKQFSTIFRRHRICSTSKNVIDFMKRPRSGHHFSTVCSAVWHVMTDPRSVSSTLSRPNRSLLSRISPPPPLRHPLGDSRRSRKNFWIIYIFFSLPREPTVAVRDMQMRLLFCRPFECLMSTRRQNSALLPVRPRSSRFFLFLSHSVGQRTVTRPDVAKVNEVKKAVIEKEDEKDESS